MSDVEDKACRLMTRCVSSLYVGNPQVRRFMQNQERESYKAQVREVQALYEQKLAQGYTPAQAATSQSQPVQIPFNTQPRNYTVSDGYTLSTIATQFNTTPDVLLAANPQVKQLQTGLVINTPQMPKTQPIPKYQQYAPQYEAAGLLGSQAPNLSTGGGAEFWDRLLQSLGMPTIYGERGGIAPTIW